MATLIFRMNRRRMNCCMLQEELRQDELPQDENAAG
jgi:hypothetical protein